MVGLKERKINIGIDALRLAANEPQASVASARPKPSVWVLAEPRSVVERVSCSDLGKPGRHRRVERGGYHRHKSSTPSFGSSGPAVPDRFGEA
jgi:hypothetical protein